MKTTSFELRRWLATGTGVGIDIGEHDLNVTVARVRPSGVRVLGAATIAGYRERPAADCGRVYQDLLKRTGTGHLSANVLLPRRDVIVRQLAFPGVADRDLAAAIQFQIDSLHPYAEEDIAWDWRRIGRGSVLLAIARREVIERYVTLFSEAGIKVSQFSFSAAAYYAAVRLPGPPPADGFLAFRRTEDGFEAYGESPAKPVFSAEFDCPLERAASLAAAELRLAEGNQPVDIEAAIPSPVSRPEDYDLSRNTLAYVAALAGACPRLAPRVNLLPAENRSSNSRLIFVPTAALGLALVAALIVLGSVTPIEDRRYLAALERETARIEPQARQAAVLDASIEAARARIQLLDDFRLRTKQDLDTFAELTKVIQSPAWLTSFDMSPGTVNMAGLADSAGSFLKLLDASPFFTASQFTTYAKQGKSEAFRIRTTRRGGRR
jgi:Tfp pilus assembly protein PilN